MKFYKIKVNGKVYEVELESVSESAAKIESPKPVQAAPAASSGTKVAAPMQGQIVKLAVGVGAKVSKGAVLAVLEAMKLENEILAPVGGTVLEILVAKGQTVESQQPLFVLG
jgi:biotin carboxyl carrier protein